MDSPANLRQFGKITSASRSWARFASRQCYRSHRKRSGHRPCRWQSAELLARWSRQPSHRQFAPEIPYRLRNGIGPNPLTNRSHSPKRKQIPVRLGASLFYSWLEIIGQVEAQMTHRFPRPKVSSLQSPSSRSVKRKWTG